ncbi:hypothetical protein ONE63_009089 [Megalurothrips usitatus]|uniref:Uncharacterized protein n=1 Tax=Megalurothrips usitatus TaxID=439358 RepID=A0AAV7XR20_9NEOP|nr:hypothetical protein ONE63_009089 [Megalurothrips usitatus]
MGSTRCRHFVQNAWKKELCSNCFKSKDEHAAPAPRAAPLRHAAVPALPDPPPQGILKGASWTRGKTRRVYFPAEESEVIGEGGDDVGSDDDSDSDDGDWSSPPVEDDPQELEEQRLLQALTRSNTDFNSVSANLEGTSSASPKQQQQKQQARQVQGPLQLGRPQTDAEGRKQTLLVSVQPFGKPGKAAAAEHVTKIPVSAESTASAPAAATANGGVVLKSVVITDASPPTTKTKVPSTEASSATTAPSAAANPSPTAAANPSLTAATAPTPSTPRAPAPSATLLKLNDAQVPSVDKTPAPAPAAPLSSKHMFLKSIVEPAADAASPIPAATVKPSAAPATPAAPVTVSSSPKAATTTKTTALASAAKSAVSPTKTTSSASPAATAANPARREGKRTHITRGTPISKNNELLLKTKFIPLRTSTILNNNNNNSTVASNNKRNAVGQREAASPPSLAKANGARDEPVMLIQSKRLDSSDEDEEQRTYCNVQVQSKRLDEADSSGSQTKRLASLLAPLAVGAVGVGPRELAGEPDGRADPDSSSESGSEPPALPQSPPPAVDPRPSFLHGLTARLASGAAATSPATTFDKPRVPYKSSTVVQAANATATATAVQQQRWSQVSLQLQQHQQAKAAAVAAAAASVDAPQAPSCSPPSSPEASPASSPVSSPSPSPQGTPPSENGSRSHKRQAPQPPQASPPSTPVKETAPATILRPALGRSASTGSSSSCSSPSPGASPPSPVLSSVRKASLSPHKDARRRSSQHLLLTAPLAPLPPLAPSRSESVPSGLSQVALGHSVTLGAHSGHSIAQALAQANSLVSMSPSAQQPQPSPRRGLSGLSLSTDSLSGTSPNKHVMTYDTERKKPGTKVRFSLRKFLGLTKDAANGIRAVSLGPGAGGGAGADPVAPPQPRPRPRLEIIHPSDLSGRAVEVLRASGVEVRRQMQEAAAAQAQLAAANSPSVVLRDHRRNSDSAALHVDGHSSPMMSSLTGDSDHAVKARPNKPPPPPRSQSLEYDPSTSPGGSPGHAPPHRPPPPKSAHVDLLMRRLSSTTTTSTAPPTPPPGHSVYANVACVGGEMRPSPGVAPLKPQRTGSVRDSTAEGPRRTPLAEAAAGTTTTTAKDNKDPPKMPTRTCSLSSQPEDSGYESVELSDSAQPQSMTDSDNVYECVNSTGERSSSPECDSTSASSKRASSGSSGGGGPKASADRPTSAATHYCGSETESDIYSPYSFYGSEEGDDQEGEADVKWRSGRVRKGRCVVHKSMEENYDAVVGANLEALAQLLEQIRAGPAVPTSLRPLRTASDLTWTDFTQGDEHAPVVAGRWAFLAARWGCQPVTLAVLPGVLAKGAGAHGGRGPLPFALLPIAEFADRVPAASLPPAVRPAACGGYVQALVGVLARARVDTLASYGAWLRGDGHHGGEDAWREAGLAMLQLLNALLAMHTLRMDKAVEPDSVVLLRDPAQPHATPQLAMLGLHSAASDAVRIASVRVRIAQPLNVAPLARAKAVLEYWLWGPSEAVCSPAALQRWLDLERATVLHRLVCAKESQRLAIQQQSHLLFLVHTNAAAMADAARLLDAARVSTLETSS